jgi:hypothetical protein
LEVRLLAVVLAAGCALAELFAATAEARLRPVASLSARADTEGVWLRWRDRSRGEPRYVVRRAGRRVRLKPNRRRFLDASVAPATRYRYVVLPCRHTRCAKPRVVTVTSLARGAMPGGGGSPAGSGAPGSGGSPGGGGGTVEDRFAGSPTIGDCPIFPNDNPWNTDISQAPVDTSHDYVGSLGSMTLWPGFGGGGMYGMPYVSVPFTQPLVPMTFEEPGESDPGPYPTPLDAPVEPGSDRHVVTLRQGDCKLFELYAAERAGEGWHAYSGAVFDLRSNALRPEGWTSADAAGLPILPGLARREEADAGVIRHALRISIPYTQRAFIHPATHWSSSDANPDLPPMGLRLRLKASYDISRLYGHGRVVAEALKTYGVLVADNAGSERVYIGGALDPGWDDAALNGLKTIPASALEAVQTGPVVTP